MQRKFSSVSVIFVDLSTSGWLERLLLFKKGTICNSRFLHLKYTCMSQQKHTQCLTVAHSISYLTRIGKVVFSAMQVQS